MTTTTTSRAATTTDTLARILFSRRGAVYLPSAAGADRTPEPPVDAEAGTAALEYDLVERGYLLSADLRTALANLSAADLVGAGAWLLADIDAALGANHDHVPLFRSFPESTHPDTAAFFVDRVLSALFQQAEQPCVLCGVIGQVHAVSPCAHLVCRDCFDGADFSACPICHRRIDADDPFLTPAPDRGPRASGPPPQRLRVLGYGGDHARALADAGTELTILLGRTGAASPEDTAHLIVLLDTRDRADLGWVPSDVPGREPKARLLSWLLADEGRLADTLPAVRRLTGTATDVLRTLAVRSGGNAGLTGQWRFAAMSRPLRRAILSLLDGLAVGQVAEDLRRNRPLWIRAAGQLHPYEHASAYPRAAAAFAVIRGTRLDGGDPLGDTIRATVAGTPGFDAGGAVLRHRSFATAVETSLAAGDVPGAVALLHTRPGEFVRRLDHLIRLATTTATAGGIEVVLAALPEAARGAAPAVLLAALGELRGRHLVRDRRVFFPKGATAKTHLAEETRTPLQESTVDAVVTVLIGELLRRAGTLPAAEVAVIDTGLCGLTAPFTQRTASRALVTLPRGSRLPLPDGRTLRFFLHWQQPTGEHVDLDLSAALFDAAWQHVATCDYTNLRAFDTAAVHSGDLTSAPAPQGASEFLDLDVTELRANGVRYVVAAVYSYSGQPFVAVDQAYAGVMVVTDPHRGPVFDPQAVEQRFDLTGSSRAVVPVVLDLDQRTLCWLDLPQGVSGTHHAVHRHVDGLAALADATMELFTSTARVGLAELATWHAAARATTVYVRAGDGSAHRFARRDDESPTGYATRIGTALAPQPLPPIDHDGQSDELPGVDAGLAYLLRGDLPVAAAAEVYALYPAQLDAAAVRLLAATDLATDLAVPLPTDLRP